MGRRDHPRGAAGGDQVYLPRNGSITAKTVTLNFNGTSFRGLRHGSTDLVNGVDYTVSGTALTLTLTPTATMEAEYAGGSPAGPADWTPFKEFWQHFQPDHTAGTIILKPEFFAEVDDGRVTLTFHFWSGVTTTYHLTKSGDTTTGNTA